MIRNPPRMLSVGSTLANWQLLVLYFVAPSFLAQPCSDTHPLASPRACAQGDCGRIMMVLLTDGRANVSLAKSNEDPDALKPDAPKPSQVWLSVVFPGGSWA